MWLSAKSLRFSPAERMGAAGVGAGPAPAKSPRPVQAGPSTSDMAHIAASAIAREPLPQNTAVGYDLNRPIKKDVCMQELCPKYDQMLWLQMNC